jgi:hypothetical protein
VGSQRITCRFRSPKARMNGAMQGKKARRSVAGSSSSRRLSKKGSCA